ncbi:MAG: response regulator [Myxococcales bacterium]|nr:response regulator [Myxococcales bacterium]
MAHILCVDDVPDNLKLLAMELEDAGHRVDIADSGAEALERVATHRPDLVILDILMPRMNGLEVLSKLRARHSLTELPVLMATIVDDEGQIVEALELGANDYVVKPLEIDVVLARVNTQIRALTLTRERDELNRLKEEFLGIAVHDLRQPLMAIRGLIDLLRGFIDEIDGPGKGDGRKQALEDLQEMRRASESMAQLLDGLLDLRLVDHGKLELQLTEVDAGELASTVLLDCRSYAESKRSTLVLGGEAQGVVMSADRQRLSQVLGNLVNNAVKYSPPGSLVRLGWSADESWVRFEVSDQGPGVPTSERPRLFRKFSRLSTKPSGDERSTGLGLFIAKTLVEAHGGEIDVRNNPEGGATFFFGVPRIAH